MRVVSGDGGEPGLDTANETKKSPGARLATEKRKGTTTLFRIGKPSQFSGRGSKPLAVYSCPGFGGMTTFSITMIVGAEKLHCESQFATASRNRAASKKGFMVHL
jgi:hypothetical protein